MRVACWAQQAPNASHGLPEPRSTAYTTVPPPDAKTDPRVPPFHRKACGGAARWKKLLLVSSRGQNAFTRRPRSSHPAGYPRPVLSHPSRRRLTGVGPDVAFQIKGVVEALPAEGAQVPLHLAVALDVPVQHALQAEALAAQLAGVHGGVGAGACGELGNGRDRVSGLRAWQSPNGTKSGRGGLARVAARDVA